MANQKTLEDLAKQVIDSQEGLMSVEDLKTFFDDKPQATNPVNQVPVEPVTAPTPQASTEPPVIITEPVVSKPTIPDFVPDKFKGGDPATSMERMARSYVELEAELNKEREERTKLDGMLQNLSTPTLDTPVTSVGDFDQDEVEESLFFDKPKEATKKVASQVAAAMLMAYHTQLTEASKRIQYVEGFKSQHPDFADYKEDMAAILKSRPDLDKRVDSLPIVYETAKARYRGRLDKMRKELGVTEPIPQVQPTSKSTLTDEQLIERAKTAILDELKKRRAASGITGGTAITNPTERGQPVITEKPKTPEDKIFEEMMGSGRSKLSIEL